MERKTGFEPVTLAVREWQPRPDSNRGAWFRKPMLYPLSYGAWGTTYRFSRDMAGPDAAG